MSIVKTAPSAVGVCEACDAIFKSHWRQVAQSEWEIQVQFARHRCNPQDATRNAVRMVKEGIQKRGPRVLRLQVFLATRTPSSSPGVDPMRT
jgi:hypothetical protein